MIGAFLLFTARAPWRIGMCGESPIGFYGLGVFEYEIVDDGRSGDVWGVRDNGSALDFLA